MKNIEEKNNIEEVKEKKNNISKVIILIILVIVSLIGVFFLSTYIRWNAEIDSKNEILYYGQDEYKINSLKDFYDNDIELNLNDDEALLMYCSNSYGGDCITGDYSNKLENMFRSPWVIINVVLVIDFILLYVLLKDKELNNILVYVIFVVILLYGIYGVGLQIYNIADYYHLVNDTDYVTNGQVIKRIVTENKDTFRPVVKYNTDKGEFIQYIDIEINEDFNDKKNGEITLYYDKKDNTVVTPKRSLVNCILPIIVSLITLFISFIFLKLRKKDKYKIN